MYILIVIILDAIQKRKKNPTGRVNSLTGTNVNVMLWYLCQHFLQEMGVHHNYLQDYLENSKEYFFHYLYFYRLQLCCIVTKILDPAQI